MWGSAPTPTARSIGSSDLPLDGVQKKEYVGLSGPDVYCFEPYQPAYKRMTEIVRGYYKGDWTSVSKVPGDVKKVWFEEFKKRFYWDVLDVQMQKAFQHQAADHIANVFKGHRKRKTVPDFVTKDQWARIEKKRVTDPAMIHQAAVNKQNKASQKAIDSSVYHGGSRKLTKWIDVVEVKEGKRPKISEMVQRLYSKDGVWTGPRPKAILKKYEELVATQKEVDPISEDGECEHQERDKEKKIWAEACGGPSNGRLYGLGEEGKGLIRTGKVSATPSQVHYQARDQGIRDEVQELRSTVVELVKNQQEFQSTIIRLLQVGQASSSPSGLANSNS